MHGCNLESGKHLSRAGRSLLAKYAKQDEGDSTLRASYTPKPKEEGLKTPRLINSVNSASLRQSRGKG